MLQKRIVITLVLFFCCFELSNNIKASQINVEKYGLTISNVGDSNTTFESILKEGHVFELTKSVSFVSNTHHFDDRTIQFYLILLLVTFFGIFRYFEPQYLRDLFINLRSTTNTYLTNKQKSQSVSFLSLCLNLFFTISIAVYVFYIIQRISTDYLNDRFGIYLIPMLIFCFLLIYLVKFLVIKFSGWAFKLEDVTERYLYNVFLLNKVLGILLLPFIILLAFGNKYMINLSIYISLSLILIMLLFRYLKSWQVFGAFFKYSKFHFFTYLCASELLPLAILMKLIFTKILA